MRYPARVAIGAALATGTLLTGGVGHAQPGESPAPQCTVPDQAVGKFLILRGNSPSVPLAPASDFSMVVARFPTADSMQYMVVGTGIWHDGTYTYTVPEPGRAVLDATQTDTGQPISYSLSLRCSDNMSGNFTVGDSEPSPDRTATYMFQNMRP
ncbi:hypothetical protein [Nocardia sp. NPDC057668]|uniref:hypothetical protein n=1 Tax=Nocardia sp. NPDC057668 TaxID=3346202 RepID=UPI00366F1A91